MRQSMPSRRIDNCAGVRTTRPSSACGQTLLNLADREWQEIAEAAEDVKGPSDGPAGSLSPLLQRGEKSGPGLLATGTPLTG